MESLTPDQDELAERQAGQDGQPDKKARNSKSLVKGDKEGKDGNGGGGSGGNGSKPPSAGGNRRLVGLLLLLIVTVAATGGWSLWEHQQQLREMNVDLQQAQNWISESRLQSARLEGDLAQADQQLSETGSAVQEQLMFLDTEMRKLWAVAHQTNRPAIAENKKVLETLRADLGTTTGTAGEAREQASQALAASEARESELKALQQELASVKEGRDNMASQLEALREQMAKERQALEQTITRASRDRELALEEVTARLDRLERDLDSGASEAELAALAQRLDKLEPIVDSVDSARGQLTRRFTDLGERVDRLAQQISNP